MSTLSDHWDAKDYAQNSAIQQKWAGELIEKLKLKGNESGLDIGCGDGKITAQIASLLPDGTMSGIDFSPAMIALAREHHQALNLSFQVMNATHINLPLTFDFAFSNATLHWVTDHWSVLTSLRQNLKRGARILFQMGGQGNGDGIVAAFEKVISQPKWSACFVDFEFPYSFYGTDRYEAWLPQAGYRQIRNELIPKDMVHDSREHLTGWLRTTWFPYINKVEPARRMEFLDRVVDEYLGHYPVDSQGRTHVAMVRLEIEAVAI